MTELDKSPQFATVVLDSSMNRAFDYAIPTPIQKKLKLGSRVRVPFRKSEVMGTVVDFPFKPQVHQLKSILNIQEHDPFLSGTGLELARWIAKYYCCSVASAMKAVFPLSLRKNTLMKRKITEEDFIDKETILPEPIPVLTQEQKQVLDCLIPAIEQKEFYPFLLHGVTGSGKTEVYLRSLEATLNQGRKAIVVVPEISLTPQTVERFRSRFSDNVAVWHSQLTLTERRNQWNKIKRGEVSIVIGARSAIFVPLSPLGLIVVDEEHEKSYKQGETPRYHARDLAVMRAYLEKAAVILGSATPALESYHNVEKKKYHLGVLKKRIYDRPLPAVQVIDMREVLKREKGMPVFSRELLNAISDRLQKKEQIILFLNRRGYSNFVLCRHCGFILKCQNCSLSLTTHQKGLLGKCHMCGYSVKLRSICPSCKEGKLSLLGIGTQKVEKQILKIFPSARVERLDSDITTKRGASERILRAFRDGKVDILIGTQMIAKGLDFPKVTLTGIVLADVTLHVPDFRSGEYTFQLLTQVAGRAGRGHLPGEVLIQTFTPNHPAIQTAKNHDFLSFYEQELRFRKELNYPPYTHFLVLTVQGKKEEQVKRAIQAVKKELRSSLNGVAEISGPMAAPLSRINKKFRWQLIFKGKKVLKVNQQLQKVFSKVNGQFPVQFLVDVDPTIML